MVQHGLQAGDIEQLLHHSTRVGNLTLAGTDHEPTVTLPVRGRLGLQSAGVGAHSRLPYRAGRNTVTTEFAQRLHPVVNCRVPPGVPTRVIN